MGVFTDMGHSESAMKEIYVMNKSLYLNQSAKIVYVCTFSHKIPEHTWRARSGTRLNGLESHAKPVSELDLGMKFPVFCWCQR